MVLPINQVASEETIVMDDEAIEEAIDGIREKKKVRLAPSIDSSMHNHFSHR
jgi:hypothetical protein